MGLTDTKTFRSLRIRNYRLYFVGQLVSVSGTWMQSVAQMWLVLSITGSGTAMGVTMALQFTPMLLFGAWAGVLADRTDKRRLLIGAQFYGALLALVLGVLTATGTARLWNVWLLALLLGVFNAIDTPARQSFVMEMVGPEHLTNAVGLNSSLMTSARIIGPAIGGLIINSVGLEVCFFLNSASFAGVLLALWRMDPDELVRGAPVARTKGQLREGLRYVWSEPDLRLCLLMMAVIGTLAYNFQVTLALLARYAFGGGPASYGALTSVMSVGTVIGALMAARRSGPSRRLLVGSAYLLGVLILVTAAAPTIVFAAVALLLMGIASMTFVSTGNTTLQLASDPSMRGRVMALYAVVFLGSTPIGGPIVGWVSSRFGPRAGLAVGGIACLAAATGALWNLRHRVRPTAVDLLAAVRARRRPPSLAPALAAVAEHPSAEQLDGTA